MAADALPSDPTAILRLDADGADRLLDVLEERVPRRPPYVGLPGRDGARAVVFGDTHGDWRSTQEVVRAFEAAGPSAVLVGLGDYVDRPPDDLPSGSVANALFLLTLAARVPDRVVLLQGNHETMRSIPAVPHTLPGELSRLWGPSPQRYARLMGLLERGPVAATVPCGAYLAHAGFPRGQLPTPWHRALEPLDEQRLLELVWAESDASLNRRGAVAPWTEAELERFLRVAGLLTLWRGHDPDLAGRPLCHARAMTLHTTRIYARYGGVLLAVLPLDRPMPSVGEAELRHLATERTGAVR